MTNSSPALPPSFIASVATAALERAWTAIAAHHPDIPPHVVVVIGPGSDGKPNDNKWGHWSGLRWRFRGAVGAADGQNAATPKEGTENAATPKEGEAPAFPLEGEDGAAPKGMHELLLAGERLAYGPAAVIETLLHEGAHALATTRKIDDTTNRNRYHNKRFVKLAEEMGLTAEKMAGPWGWAETDLTEATRARYADLIASLEEPLSAYRLATKRGEGKKRTDKRLVLECLCSPPRKLHCAAKVAEQGEIRCGVCDGPFLTAEQWLETGRDGEDGMEGEEA